MTTAARRRAGSRTVPLDRALELLPLFRLSDSSEDVAITYALPDGGRWRVLPTPGDRLPGTFDQDVYVELMRRWHDADSPTDGVLRFTLHDFLRSMGRRADGRTYELLRAALGRLERTVLESQGALRDAHGTPWSGSFTLLSAVTIDRRRTTDREQMSLFPVLAAGEPGDARVILSPTLRMVLARRTSTLLSLAQYRQLSSPVARRLYRLLEAWRADGHLAVERPLEALAEQLPLAQRYPSHLQRVLQPAHEILLTAGLVRRATIEKDARGWRVTYVVAPRGTPAGVGGFE
jgi:plasmid replication initiation protein